MMKEFLVWSNCTNSCDFCWQQKRPNKQTFLDNTEKIESLQRTIDAIEKFEYSADILDVLIVGGEAFCFYDSAVTQKMSELFRVIKQKMDNNIIRYFYVNTNLLYADLINIENLIEIFAEKVPMIKFTTSYDIYGRFFSKEKEDLFLRNLEYLTSTYPNLNIVVNCILTKQMCDEIKSGRFNVKDYKERYNLSHVNLLPYIALPGENTMKPRLGEIIKTLEIADKQIPGYLDFYYHDYNDNQNKVLYEYNKGIGYVECTAYYSECGHNQNFKRTINDKQCYICAIKKYLEDKGTSIKFLQ